MHWVIVLHLGLEGCSQPRELWFVDILMTCTMNPDLSTELKVCHHYGNLGAGDDENDKHEEQESKQVIELVLPDCCQDEEQLNKHSTKWQNTSYQ